MTEQNEGGVYPRGCTPCIQPMDDSPFFDGCKPMAESPDVITIVLSKGRQTGKSITSGMLHEKMHADEQRRLGLITAEQYNEMMRVAAEHYGIDIDEPKQEPPTS